MVTAGHIAKAMRDIDDEARKNDWVRAVVDVPGVGGGVVDRLAELELPVVPYNGGEAPIDKERFVNAPSGGLLDIARALRIGRGRH
jgi:hypothetical protein